MKYRFRHPERRGNSKTATKFCVFLAAACAIYTWINYTQRHTGRTQRIVRPALLTPCGLLTYAQPSRVWVAFGTDFNNMQYAANAPLSAYIWRHHIGFFPIVFAVTHTNLTMSAEHVVDAIRDAGGMVEIVHPRHTDATQTMAQLVRIATFALPFISDHDYIVTTDADIWPMSQLYWKNALNFNQHFTIVNGEFFRQHVHVEVGMAMCYIGAMASTWKVLILHSVDAITSNMSALQPLSNSGGAMDAASITNLIIDAGKEFRKERWAGLTKGGHQWFWDQVFLTYAFRHLVKTCNATYATGANLQARRLDRSGWNFNGDIEHYTDAHLIYPLTAAHVWSKLMDVWHKMFNTTVWPETYRSGLLQKL